MENENVLYTQDQLALAWQKPPAVLANWRYMGLGPKFIKIGKSVRYRASDLETYLDAQTRTRTGER